MQGCAEHVAPWVWPAHVAATATGADVTDAQLDRDIERDTWRLQCESSADEMTGSAAGAPAIPAAVARALASAEDDAQALAALCLRVGSRTVSAGDALVAALQTTGLGTPAECGLFRDSVAAMAASARADAVARALIALQHEDGERREDRDEPAVLPWTMHRTRVPADLLAALPRPVHTACDAVVDALVRLDTGGTRRRDSPLTLVPDAAAAAPVHLTVTLEPDGAAPWAEEVAATTWHFRRAAALAHSAGSQPTAHAVRKFPPKPLPGCRDVTLAQVALAQPACRVARVDMVPSPTLAPLIPATWMLLAGGRGLQAAPPCPQAAIAQWLTHWSSRAATSWRWRSCTVIASTRCRVMDMSAHDADPREVGALVCTFRSQLAWPASVLSDSAKCDDASSAALHRAARACGFPDSEAAAFVGVAWRAHPTLVAQALMAQAQAGGGWRVWDAAPQVLRRCAVMSRLPAGEPPTVTLEGDVLVDHWAAACCGGTVELQFLPAVIPDDG